MRPSLRALPALLFSLALSAAAIATDARKSGFEFMQPSTQALQKDDTQNPAMLWVKAGEALWNKPEGAAAKSCASCHGEIGRMKSVATRYPAYSSTQAKVINLSQQVNLCRVTQQQVSQWPAEHESLLGLEAAIAKESRGLPISPPTQSQLADAQTRGEALFNQRIGQVDLSCRDCHETLAGRKLGGNVIPQGHATGYPIYRLEWQSVGSLQRRLRGCMTAVRAEPYAHGASELIDLEAYLAKRAAGMKLETPGVRP
ncbi:MAG: sulfur oxidation c-type cytochrome SoxA [Burkholderiales bacterium]|nr:MAG: sulfur oxidation c-type cytochrome SoxA [Betaproteobacteria bacterium]TAG84667.1 MAG: sulfur oxidation c-type cytochrome SoxA [Burkholderiales bacterium]